MTGPYVGVAIVSFWSLWTDGPGSPHGQLDGACLLMSLMRILEIGGERIIAKMEGSR